MQLRLLHPLLLVAPALLLAQGTPTPRITEQTSGVTALLQAAHATSARVVWASGHRGVVVRTIDGGETWEQLATPGGDSLEFRDVHALNADTAWILAAGTGSKSRIYRTNDGGKTWALQFLNDNPGGFYDCMTMFDRSRGIAYGDATDGKTHILRTADGGRTWALLDASKVPAPLPGEGAFAASGLCVVHADANTAFIATGAPGARVFRSIDGGESWTAINTTFVRGRVAGLTGMSFMNARRGIAVGANIDRLRDDKSEQTVGVTDDGGLTWSLRPRPPLGGALAGVTWVPSAGRNVAVAVGYGGAFYTTDAAQSWQVLTQDGYMGVTAFGKTVWMTGANGKILRLDF